MAVALLVLSILSLVLYFDMTSGFNDVPATLDTAMVFLMIFNVGALLFGSGLVVGSLVTSSTPAWARVTMICVAALIFLGSNVVSGLFLGQNF